MLIDYTLLDDRSQSRLQAVSTGACSERADIFVPHWCI